MASSHAAWAVSEPKDEPPVPLVPIPRLIRIVDAFRELLTADSVNGGARAVARELDEDPRLVGALAEALVKRVEGRKERQRPVLSLDEITDPGDDNRVRPGIEPTTAAAHAEQLALDSARERFLIQLEETGKRLSGSPKKVRLLLYLREVIAAEVQWTKAGTPSPLLSDDGKWSTMDLYASFRLWLNSNDNGPAINQQMKRFRELPAEEPALAAALADYLSALADVQNAMCRQEDGHEQPLV